MRSTNHRMHHSTSVMCRPRQTQIGAPACVLVQRRCKDTTCLSEVLGPLVVDQDKKAAVPGPRQSNGLAQR